MCFMEALGRRAKAPGRIYLVGGASALLLGWRDLTIDVDIKLDPESREIFEAIADLKKELDINVELVAPDQFVPPLVGWRERSSFIKRYGEADFFHYDFYGQVLAKIERNHCQDLADALVLVNRGFIVVGELVRLFELAVDDLIRYPAIDASAFRVKLETFVSKVKNNEESD